MTSPSDFRPLGSTGLACHPLGFGCYRIADGNVEHEAALRNYLGRGGNLIDTSANYTDGQSEILVGRVVKSYPRDQVIVVTKGGYIQGQNMQLAQSQTFSEVVKYGEGQHSDDGLRLGCGWLKGWGYFLEEQKSLEHKADFSFSSNVCC